MTCNNCSDSSILQPEAVLSGPDQPKVLASYGLCTTLDEFIEDKCIWIIELKDGSKIFQDDDRPGIYPNITSAWKRLGRYVKDHPDNKIAKMRLRFGTHVVELPSNQPFYFYSKGLMQSVSQSYGLDFHIVGWRDNSGDILTTWYKAPELEVASASTRPLSECQPEQLIGDLTSIAPVL